MLKRRLSVIMSSLLVLALQWGIGQSAYAQSTSDPPPGRHGRPTPAERRAAAKRAKAARAAVIKAGGHLPNSPTAGQTPDYFGQDPNWALSPITMKKFTDNLPGLTPAGINGNGQYLPVAVADTATFTGSDYYEIGLVDFDEQMSSSLLPNKTRIRGYVQLKSCAAPGAVALTPPTTAYAVTYASGAPVCAVDKPHYLGPVIIGTGASQGTIVTTPRPVRITFRNLLPTGAAGNLVIPVDLSYMGAGLGPDGTHIYTQNRATLHAHGGITPWISDGTPHQWTSPANEAATIYNRGDSVAFVPDMWFDATTHAFLATCQGATTCATANSTNDPGPGSLTFFLTNQQSARFMFYHDHAYGITRLNVYAGEAAGFLLTDPVEQTMINGGTIATVPPVVVAAGTVPAARIPLVFQDKTFVDANPANSSFIGTRDPTWNNGITPGTAHTGDLWFPHVYLTNQNPADPFGSNGIGRWDYGQWFWPAMSPTQMQHPDIPNPYFVAGTVENLTIPGMGAAPSGVPESFMDTPIVNGTPYPVAHVEPKAYRFNILNANNDRMLNLQLYYAEPLSIALSNGGSGYLPPPAAAPAVTIAATGCTAAATAFVDNFGVVGALTLNAPPVGTCSNPTVTIAPPPAGVTATAVASAFTEVKMVPAVPHTLASTLPSCAVGQVIGKPSFLDPRTGFTNPVTGCWPLTDLGGDPAAGWPTDGRDGGVPDPTTVGPSMFIIGNEAGVLPQVQQIDNRPVVYEYARRSITVLNVYGKALWLAPAERADVVVDFTGIPAGSKLILYNDAATPVPAFDPRLDYYTGDPDQSMGPLGDNTGGAPTTLPGFGPNTRTIMQFSVDLPFTTGGPLNLAGLTTAIPAAFKATQPTPVVPEPIFNLAYGTAFTGVYSRIQDTSLTFTPMGGPPASQGIGSLTITNVGSGYTSAPTVTLTGGGGAGAVASAFIGAGAVTHLVVDNPGAGYTSAPTVTLSAPPAGVTATATASLGFAMLPKAIQELFENNYGRMNATLGTELPFTNFATQTTIPLGYTDPVTESFFQNENQIWKITHNGVDTHGIHFHLFNVQIINRVGWDGVIKPPLAWEAGWKDTVVMNPLEDVIVAIRPIVPTLPFKLGDSVRRLDVTLPIGATSVWNFTNINPFTNNPVTTTNDVTNFGWEYVWHCHILGHEENDMMRPMSLIVSPAAPTTLTATASATSLSAPTVTLNWTNNATAPAATGYLLQRATNAGFTANLVSTPLGVVNTFVDSTVAVSTQYWYRVRAENAVAFSPWSNVVTVTTACRLANPPRSLTASIASATSINSSWLSPLAPPPGAAVTGIQVQVARNLAGPWTTKSGTLAPGATSFLIPGLSRTGRPYYIRALSLSAGGCTNPSNVFTVPVF